MRASGAPADLEDFDDEFEIGCPAEGARKKYFEMVMWERLGVYEVCGDVAREMDERVMEQGVSVE
jgi:hypothetical protein